MPKNYARLPWTKNFRKTPRSIESRLEGMAGAEIIVACSKIITGDELERGTYEHVSPRCAATKLMTEKSVSEQTWQLLQGTGNHGIWPHVRWHEVRELLHR